MKKKTLNQMTYNETTFRLNRLSFFEVLKIKARQVITSDWFIVAVIIATFLWSASGEVIH